MAKPMHSNRNNKKFISELIKKIGDHLYADNYIELSLNVKIQSGVIQTVYVRDYGEKERITIDRE